MTPPDIDGLPTLDDPPLVYRVLEELDDGRVRYESCDGVQTGVRVGRYVVRDGSRSRIMTGCVHCDKRASLYSDSCTTVDDLCDERPAAHMWDAASAYVVADELSRRGDSHLMEKWFCAQVHRADAKLTIQSFREWQEERAS